MSNSNKNQFHATDTLPKSDNFQTLGIKKHKQLSFYLKTFSGYGIKKLGTWRVQSINV